MASANLFQSYLQAPKSVLDYQDEFARSDALKNQNAMQSLALQQASAKTSQDLAERNALQRIAAGWSSNTSPDQRAGDLYNSGLPGLIAQGDSLKKTAIEQQKGAASAAKDQAEADAKTAEIKWKLADRHAQQLNMVQTPEDAVAYIDEGIREGSLPMQGRDRAIAMIQQNGVQAWKQMASQSAVPVLEKFKQDAEQRRAQLTADTQIQTTGMNNATSRANTAATQAGENARAGATLTETARHNQATEGGKAPLNEGQAKALGFGSRMQEADKLLGNLASKGATTPGLIKQGVESIPGVGTALGMGVNSLPTFLGGPNDNQQSVEQAQRDFVNAILRRESGAAISPAEFDNARKQYFTQPGDAEQVIAQKARNRALAIQGVMSEVPPAQRSSLSQPSAAMPAVDAITAELKRRAGK
jgi:hypothetical protein